MQVNETGKIFFTHTKLNGQIVLRMSIGQTNTEEKHVKKAWKLLKAPQKQLDKHLENTWKKNFPRFRLSI